MCLTGGIASLPTFWSLLIPFGEQIDPGGCAFQLHINGRTKVIEVVLPCVGQWHRFLSLERFCPYTLHLWVHFTIAVFSNSSAWSIAQGFRAGHWAGHTRGVQDTLAAHTTVPDGLLDRMLD